PIETKYGGQLDEQAINYLNRLKQSSFGMSSYISNILDYYETDNISFEDYEEEPFDLKTFLEGIVDMLNIEADCEINLPEKTFGLICNRSGLEQILLNLLGNSLKYNNKDKIVIDISCEEEDDFYRFSITDNGMGIPKEKQKDIFSWFSTATETDRHGQKGNGIGLSSVHKLVHNLGGEIRVDSKVGEYTNFTFTIKKPKAKKTA